MPWLYEARATTTRSTGIYPAPTIYRDGSGLVDRPLHDAFAELESTTVSRLVGMYIDYIHDQPHSLFHVPTLRSGVLHGTIEKPLLCSILALSARFHADESVRSLGDKLAKQAASLLKNDLETMSLSRIQAWVLLGNVAGSTGDSSSEAMYFGIAMRCAQIMGLSNAHAEDGAVLSETKSRVWWTLYMIDRWPSAGLGIPRQMGERRPSQQLPLDEWAFRALPSEQASWPKTPQPGMWAYMITLAEIFGSIHDLNKLSAMHQVNPQETQSAVESLARSLSDWQGNLPQPLRLSKETLELHRGRAQGRTFVALHLGYYHYATLLFFQFLDQSAEDTPHAAENARKCRESASAFSDLLRASYDTPCCEAMYVIVGHMAVVSSSVLMHILLFGEEDELPAARRRLELNFEILLKLRSWWPSVEGMTARLFLFQNMCIRSVGNHFKFDRWMVKFILEHAITLDDKAEMEQLQTTSPESVESPEAPELRRLSHRGRSTQSALSMLKR
ncbi:uncharacterized protein LTR77_008316 [Saxophila tyrrhenica]|uniref:Xylanolytic transcriptional activator regulatory domain-containing protein n=1 Tax=Saxophila tyrrhenica TaxID=1690608 RepID=A0AAV9P127_9PEZI|nr:hypothetical protein LTR77_008316 [Saxophila tyrrhenica]